ncbi:MAG TPA: serine hydrolase [Rectinemataceae bacterium]
MWRNLESGQKARLDAACAEAMWTEGAPLLNVGLSVFNSEDILYEGYFGTERPGPSASPFGAETRLRVASLSKHAVVMGLLKLAERGLVDLEADISGYLGFELRNPAYPGRPIALWMLPSHCSSLRDAGFYFPPLGVRISELFEKGSPYWAEGAHFASPDEASGSDLGPGSFYSYCNLGYGLLGTIIERVSGKRFDLYMDEEVFKPLGIGAAFNPGLLSEQAFSRLAPVYRSEAWVAGSPVWAPQVDDYGHPEDGLGRDFVRRLPGSKAHLEDYEPGTNGALFSPQGGMRINLRGLSRLCQTLLRFGMAPGDGTRILSPGSVAAMLQPRWRRGVSWRGGPANGDSGASRILAAGLGLMLGSRQVGLGGKGARLLWGHHGSAYGFLGGMYFDPGSGLGYAYMIGGTSKDPETFCPGPGDLNYWEAGLRARVESLIPWS